MAEDTCPVRGTGRGAVIQLPEHLDSSNAGQIHEQLLRAIDRGAAVLIADLSGTLCCDYSGAEALVRAYQRAVVNGTQLRLVVDADVVRRVLTLSGLDGLAGVYPTLQAAIAAEPERREAPAGSATAVTADRIVGAQELLDSAADTIFDVRMTLQAATELPRQAAAQRIIQALYLLDDVVRQLRHHVTIEQGSPIVPHPAATRRPDVLERSVLAQNRAALLHQRVAQTAHALHRAAADTAALLQRRADLLTQPGPIDYPTEVKRWQVLADQAEQMAECWEQRP